MSLSCSMDYYQQFDQVDATYLPRRMTDLKPWAAAWVSKRCTWYAAWEIEDGEYAGQWAFIPMGTNSDTPVFGWAPMCDLADVVREPA